MARNISLSAIPHLLSRMSDDGLVALITLDNPGFTNPIRVSSVKAEKVVDGSDIYYKAVSRGTDFVWYPFEFTLPDSNDEKSPRAGIVIDNVKKKIINQMRQVTSEISVLIEVVELSDLDTIVLSISNFFIGEAEYDAFTVSADLVFKDLKVEKFPYYTFNPGTAPGMFTR